MSSSDYGSLHKTLPDSGWPLWRRQIQAVLLLELRRNLLSRRSIWLYLLAAMPVTISLIAAVATTVFGGAPDNSTGSDSFTKIYFAFILSMITFIGCAIVFMNLIRGEILSKSLHYFFLSPIRRWVLITGKFLAGLATTVIIYGATTALCFVLIQISERKALAAGFLLSGDGTYQLTGFVFTTALACLGYGAIFLTLGLFFRNPVIPGLGFWVWESFNFFLPPMLKKIGVVHYLRSISPIPPTDGAFAIVAEPTPVWLAVPGLLLVTALALWIASLRVRRMEISYTG